MSDSTEYWLLTDVDGSHEYADLLEVVDEEEARVFAEESIAEDPLEDGQKILLVRVTRKTETLKTFEPIVEDE